MYQDPYAQQYPYSPQPGAAPYQPVPQPAAPPYAPQYAYPPQPAAPQYAPQAQQGSGPYPPQPQYAYPPQPSAPGQQYPPQYAYPPQPISVAKANPRANRAMINGIISVILSFITLVALVGYAGMITATFAIIYGFIGLHAAGRLPGNAGRGRAIAGIILGCAAWFLVLVSFLVRAMRG